MAPPEGLLQRSQSRFGGATICGFSKTALAPLLFSEKRLLQENVWQGSSGGAGEEPCQIDPYIEVVLRPYHHVAHGTPYDCAEKNFA